MDEPGMDGSHAWDLLVLGFPGLVWLLATLATPPVCIWIARRYGRTVERIMFPQPGGARPVRHSPAHGTVRTLDPPIAEPSGAPGGLRIDLDMAVNGGVAPPHCGRIVRQRLLALVIAAGLAHAAIAASVLAWLGELPRAQAIAPLAVLLSFAIWPAIARVTTANRAVVLAAIVHAAAAMSIMVLSGWSAPIVAALAAVFWIPPLALTWFTWHRRYRAVAPIVWLVGVAVFAGLLGPMLPVLEDRDRRWPLLLVPTLLLGVALVSWMALVLASRAYRHKRLGDLTLALDVHWLVFTTWYTLIGLGVAYREGGPLSDIWSAGWIFASFAGYAVVLRAGLPWVRAGIRGAQRRDLLLLRVFGLGGRSERLMESLGVGWRQLGCINLLAGPDLAAATLDLPELLDFATGRLATRFIADSAGDLHRRLAAMDAQPDPDGRYRVNELFCLGNTWKSTMTALVARSDVVLMDLRSFSAGNTGCRYELEQLIAHVPLGKIVLVLDEATDMGLLRATLELAWQAPERRTSGEPDAGADAVLRAVRIDRGDRRGVDRLMAALLRAGAERGMDCRAAMET